MSLFAELKRRNVLRAGAFYAASAWLLVQVATQVFPFFHIAEWLVRWIVVAAAIGFPFWILFSWFYEWTPHGLQRESEVPAEVSVTRETGKKLDRWIIAILSLAVVLLVADKLVLRKTGDEAIAVPEKSIAVLPFVNMSSDRENEYFVDGLTEEILNRLAQISALRVPGRTSSFAFKGRNTDLRQIGTTLSVAHVLEGSVRKSGDRLRITAQLVRTADGFHLWSNSFDRKLDDVFAVQEEIARALADALSVQLHVAEKPERPTPNLEAYNAYLEARGLIIERTPESLRRATILLEQAVQKDPNFARGWAELADVCAMGRFFGLATMKESTQSAEKAARKALALDDSIAMAHSALGDVMRDRFEFAESEAEHRRAVELNSGVAGSHSHYAAMLLTVGHLDSAMAEARRSLELEPLDWILPLFPALIHLSRGEMSESAELIRQSERISHQLQDFQLRVELLHALSSGDREGARQVLARARDEWSLSADGSVFALMENALAAAGNAVEMRPEVSHALAQIHGSGGHIDHVGLPVAAVAVFLQDKEAALDALWFDFRSPAGLDFPLIWTPVFRSLWNEPRFLELVRAMKLPAYWRAAGWGEFCRSKGEDGFDCTAR